MIEVVVWQAKKDSVFQKNGTFLKDELYFGRLSKDGNCYVIRSEEGFWIPIERYTWAKQTRKTDFFERKATIYMKNRKRLNQFDSVLEYTLGDNCKNLWYSCFKDNELYQ